MPPFLKKLSEILGSKWYPYVMFFTVLALMIAYFVYAWMGYAPTTGPMPDPWPQGAEKK